MMIIAGGEPDLCCSMAWRGAVLSERVGSMHARMHDVSRMQYARVVLM